MEKEKMSKYLMNALNALFVMEIRNKNFSYLQQLSHDFDLARFMMPIISEGTNRTHIVDLEDVIPFEIARCFTSEIIKNPMKGYKALDAMFLCKYQWIKNADRMTDGELYQALEKAKKNKDIEASIYITVCCCLFLNPNPTDVRWNNFLNNQAVILDEYSVKTTKEVIENIWEIDNVNENRIFLRFMEKRRDELAVYLKCDKDKIHLYLLDTVLAYLVNGHNGSHMLYKKEICLFCQKEAQLLKEVCNKNLIGIHWLKENDNLQLEADMNDCITQALYKITLDKMVEKYSEDEDFLINMLIHNVLIENPEEFLKDVISSFIFNLFAKTISRGIDFTYKNFNLDKFLLCDSSSILNVKISKLEATIQEKDDSLKNQKQEIDCLNSKIQRLERQLSYVTKAHNSETEKKLKEINNENERLREKITIYEEFDALMANENEDYLNCEEEIDITAISGKRMLFIGGRNEVVQKLRASFPNAVFVRDEIREINFKNFERVIIFWGNMNHSMFYKYRKPIRRQGLKVVFCNTNNMEQVHRQIFMSFQEAA